MFALILQRSELQYPGRSGRHCKGQNQGSIYIGAQAGKWHKINYPNSSGTYDIWQAKCINAKWKQLIKHTMQWKRRKFLLKLKSLRKKNLCLRFTYKIFIIYSTSHVFYMILVFTDIAQFEHQAQSNTDTNDDSFWKNNWVRIYPCIKTVQAAPVQFCWSFVSALTSSEVTFLAAKIMFNFYI